MIAMSPFSLRTVFLAKHAQHVVRFHFPIALFVTGVGFDLFSRGKRCSQLVAQHISICRGPRFSCSGSRDRPVGVALRSRGTTPQRFLALASHRGLDHDVAGDRVLVGTLARDSGTPCDGGAPGVAFRRPPPRRHPEVPATRQQGIYFTAQYRTCTSPRQRFDVALASGSAWLRAVMVRYAFNV